MNYRIDNDIGRVMRLLVLTCICVLLVIAPFPIQAQIAQIATPQPSTPSPQDMAFLNNLLNYAKTSSSSDANTFNTVVVLLAISMVGIILLQFFGIRSLTKPFLDAFNAANERAEKAEARYKEAHEALMDRIDSDTEKDRSSTRLEIQRTDSIKQLAGVTQKVVDDVETREESQKRGQHEVEQIGAHFNEAIQPVKTAADETLATLRTVEKRLDTLATKTELTEQLKPLKESVERLREAIEHQLLTPVTRLDSPPKDEPPSSSSLTPGVPTS